MYNGGKIIAGLVIFFGLLTVPFFINAVKPTSGANPSIDTPVINSLDTKECVKPADYMRIEHMKVLDEWRDEVVRDGDRKTIHVGGKDFQKSLQNGCMECHSNKKQFCDECHKYAGVKPYCWSCHFVKEEGRI
ncbi:MAG: sulfate reduction electron transfer complex DsrMKJOP subunit DsrJ [Nitrospira sp.]|nr:sulfate reduction electron transfer complex DsrMKJOP subunit DsrJ [bacterium]MBL7050243.1 sulfate reduction electron transfer complex DsrMKJOP subunit DsrJ [Nitrospira sp.]